MNGVSGLCAVAASASLRLRCKVIVRECLDLGSVRTIEDGTRFAADLQADSIDMVSIAVAVEEEFGVCVPDDVAAGISTFGAMVAAVEALMSNQGDSENE